MATASPFPWLCIYVSLMCMHKKNSYMPMTQSIWVDRAVKVTKALQGQEKPGQGKGNRKAADAGKP